MLEPSLKVEPNNVEPVNSRTIEPKVEPKLLSNKVLNNQKFDILLNQIKKVEEQNNLFHYELSEFFQEKENQQLRISQFEQTISKLQAEKQAPIKTISEKLKKREIKEKIIVKPKTRPTTKSSSNINGKSDKITLMFNHELEKQIQSFLAKNSQSFPSFSHFVRAGLLAYQKGMEIDRRQQFSGNSAKRNLRVDKELKKIYQNLPEGQKSLVFNQILTSFLATN